MKKEKAPPKQEHTKSLPKSLPEPKNKSLFFWICLIFFISGWMFVLGILVGRGSAPLRFNIKKLQQKFVDLKKIAVKKEKDRFRSGSSPTASKTDLDFYENLQGSGDNGRIKNDISPQNKKKLQKEKTSSVPRKIAIYKKIGKKKSSRKNKAVPISKKNAGDKNFIIQIASLKDAKAADQMIAKLNKNGYQAYRTTAIIPKKGTWYRIRTDNFKNKAEVDVILKQLKKEKFNPILIKR